MTDPQVELRLAQADDAAAVLALIHAAFAARRPVDPPPAALSDTLDDVTAALAASPGVVAVDGGAIVGCLLTSVEGTTGGLHRVGVDPSRRGEGIADALVRGAFEVLAELGCERVELLCRREFPETLRWWTGHGLVKVGEDGLCDVLGAALPTRVEVPTGQAMQDLGRRLGGLLRAGDVIVASGELGAGKTTLTQGIGAGLGVDGPVISPTFVLSRVHHSTTGGPDLVHVDAYRLSSEAELFDLDLDQTLGEAVTLVEWGAGIAEGLAGSHLDVDIRRSLDPDDETRVVYLTGVGPRWAGVDLHALTGKDSA